METKPELVLVVGGKRRVWSRQDLLRHDRMQSKDDFSSSMEPQRLLNSEPSGSVAYLTVKDPDPTTPFALVFISS